MQPNHHKKQWYTVLSFALILIAAQGKNEFYNKIHTFKLEGNSTFSYFYTNIYVGTPPQRQTVIVDTGSHILGFPCSDCYKDSCGKHIDKPFAPNQSMTSQDVMCHQKIEEFDCQNCNLDNNQCMWGISYSEGSSLYGHVMQDYVVVGDAVQQYVNDDYAGLDQNFVAFFNKERVKIPFGCTIRETHLFLTQAADGILGLSPQTNKRSKMPNVIDILFAQHIQNEETLSFSLCLSNKNGGYMSIGGYNHDLHLQDAKTHIISYENDGMYTINLHKITVLGEDLGVVFRHYNDVIVDSGTTVLYDHKHCDGNQEVKRNQVCFRRNPEKYPNIQDFFDTFPPIEFQLDNSFTFVWEPQNYLFIDAARDHSEDLYCFAFEKGGSRFVLGGSWMRQYDILFDRQNNKLHFTKSDCQSEKIDNNYIRDHQITDEDRKLYEDIVSFLNKTSDNQKSDEKEENSKRHNLLSEEKLVLPKNSSSNHYLVYLLIALLTSCVLLILGLIKKCKNNSIKVEEFKIQYHQELSVQ